MRFPNQFSQILSKFSRAFPHFINSTFSSYEVDFPIFEDWLKKSENTYKGIRKDCRETKKNSWYNVEKKTLICDINDGAIKYNYSLDECMKLPLNNKNKNEQHWLTYVY